MVIYSMVKFNTYSNQLNVNYLGRLVVLPRGFKWGDDCCLPNLDCRHIFTISVLNMFLFCFQLTVDTL